MPIDKEEMEKYIFDPSNPKQCKSYNLLLNIARKDNLVYIDSNYMEFSYKDIIINEDFYTELWDKSDNFRLFTFKDKIKYFKNILSNRDYLNHIESLDIDNDSSIYTKIFKKNFDFHITDKYIQISNIETKYSGDLIKHKLKGQGYNQGYQMLIKDGVYQGVNLSLYSDNKILFTDNLKSIELDNRFYNISSIIVTDIKNSSSFSNNTKINRHVKPIFLEKMEDVDLLLNVLYNDLNYVKTKSTPKENISTMDSLKIKDFFSIKNLELGELKNKKEIYIVGENGDGKTLLLQAMAIALVGIKDGDIFELLKDQNSYSLSIVDSNGQEFSRKSETAYNYLLAYGSLRSNNCQIKEDSSGYLTLFNGTYDLKNPIKWLQYLDYSEKANKKVIISTQKAKEILRHLLNSQIDIDVSPDSVIFIERGSKVSFNQLSAGYRGVITIICDLIARFSEIQEVENISEFQGIVLIDEIEVHLHPKWKYNFMKKLRDTFPLIQFIVTTHSPTVILGADKDAIFYKIYKDGGEVHISNQIPNEGYTQNSLVSSPLFDLENITSRFVEEDISSSDYVYGKIHKKISQRLRDDVNIDEDELMRLIDKELDDL